MSRLALVLGVVVAVAAMAVVAATSALQIAEGDKPTLSPDQETALLAATAETRAAAGKAADEGKKAKLAPAYIKLKFAPPEEGLRAMAARTAVTMGETWGGTLEVMNSGDGWVGPTEYPLSSSVSFGSLGGAATLTAVDVPEGWGGYWFGPAHSPDPGGTMFWAGLYWSYELTVTAPGDSETVRLAIWFMDIDAMGFGGPIPSGVTQVYNADASASFDVSISTSGLYLKRSRTATSYDDRQTMDWSDLTSVDKWFADENSTVTVTVSGDASASATGSLGYTPGAEVEIGSSYILSAAIGMNNAPTASTPYARISNINWGGTPINAVPDLYNPGDAADIPSVDIDPWSRTWTTNNAYHVYGDSGGFAIEHLAGTEADASVALKWSAPRILTLTAVDRMFDTQGDQYDPRIEYSSVFEDWDYVGGTWTATPHKFTDTYSVFEAPTNYEYEYEYEKLTSSAVSVRVTDDWREANGEDVGNDVPGGDNERYNDQLAGICLPPIDATDCVGDPWWLSGFAAVHQPEVDVNDTQGQTRRASWWLGGVGVEIDPLDNDIWTVTAGALAPAVSRSLRSRYWARMGRLQEKLDDPEAEHLADWAIMLKANLPIGETGDDPDWWEEPLLQVSGAGMAGVDGDYSEWGSAGGQQQYRSGGTYIRYDRTAGRWIMTDATLTVYYQSETLEGQWDVNAGVAPGPTVDLLWPEDYGVKSCLIEDIYSWQNYRCLVLQLIAPVDGTIRLTVTYAVPSISDPNYTGFAYEFGEEAELFGGWDHTRADYSLSYDVPVLTGGGTYVIPLDVNREGVTPHRPYHLQVVDNIRIELPPNETGADQEWELQALKLAHDPGETGRAEPATHHVQRYKPSWSWLDPNFQDDSEDAEHAPMNWFGVGAHVDGLPILQHDYGYNTSYGQVGQEAGLLYIQYRQHNPLSEATGLLHYAKSLSRLHNELDWLEGYECSWPADPAEGLHNQDQDGGQVDANLYWWDLQQSDETIDWTDVPLALCVGSHTIAAGVPYDLRFYKYPRGALHGIAYNEDHTSILRDRTAIVDLYGSADGGPYYLLETLDTDEHGRYRSTPVREMGWTYRIGEDGSILSVVNRSYTFDTAYNGAFSWEGYLDLDECGVTWLVAVGQGRLHVYWIGAGADGTRHEVTQPTTIDGHSRPSIAVAAGALYVAATLGSDMVIYRSLDRGETWAQLATDLGDGLTLGTIAWRETGEVMLCGVDATDKAVLRMASDGYLTRDDLTPGVDEITIATGVADMRTCVIRQSDGSILAAVEGSGQVDLYRCRDFGTGFAAV